MKKPLTIFLVCLLLCGMFLVLVQQISPVYSVGNGTTPLAWGMAGGGLQAPVNSTMWGSNETWIDGLDNSNFITGLSFGIYIGSGTGESGTFYARAAIYTNSLSLIAQTNQYSLTVPSASGPYYMPILNFSLPHPTVQNNTAYFFVIWTCQVDTGSAFVIWIQNSSSSMNNEKQFYCTTPFSNFPASISSPYWLTGHIYFNAYYDAEVTMSASYGQDITGFDAYGYGLAALSPSANSYASAIGETFELSSTLNVHSISLALAISGWPNGSDAHVGIYTVTGTYGVNAVPSTLIANAYPGNWNPGNVGVYPLFPPGFPGWFSFKFTGTITLTAGVPYAIVFTNPTSGTIGTSNFTVALGNNTNSYYGGNEFEYRNGAWTTAHANDRTILFKIYTAAQAGWQWRKAFTVSPSSAGTNYVIKLNVYIGSGSSSGSNVYIPSGHCNPDFSDLRFTTSYGVTNASLMSYVIVNYTYNNAATVWVKLSQDLSAGGTFFMQYGNTAATDASNGENTFLFYDDFNDASFNTTKWNYWESNAAGWYEETGGTFHIQMDVLGQWNRITSNTGYSGNIAVEGNAMITSPGSSDGNTRMGFWDVNYQPLGGLLSGFGQQTGHGHFVSYIDNGIQNTGDIDYSYPQDANFHDFSVYRINYQTVSTQSEGEIHTSTITSSATLYVTYFNVYTANSWLNWIAVRPYVNPEPTITSWGPELSNQFNFEIVNRELPLASGYFYVFSEEKYYLFRATFYNASGWNTFSDFYLSFYDQAVLVNVSYNVASQEGSILSGSDMISISTPTVDPIDAYAVNVTWGIFFNSRCKDALNIDVYLDANFTDNSTMGSLDVAPAYFNIYNVGGQSTTSISGQAGRMKGGDVFDMYAANDGNVTTSMVFRNLVHAKMNPLLNITIGGGAVDMIFGMDYMTDNDSTWIQGFNIDLSTMTTYVGSNRYMLFQASLYNHGTLVMVRNVSAYHSPGNDADQLTQTRFWIDLWFNKENFSSTVGARFNAYFYPMTDSSNIWLRWLTGSSWGADESQVKDIMLFDTLKDANGNLMYVSNVKLVRLWCELASDYTPSDIAELKDFQVFDLTFHNPYPMEGIQTPQFDATQMPRMESGGILGAIWSAISNFGGVLSNFFGPILLSFASIFVGWLDTAAGFFGFPHFFTNIIAYLGNLWTGFTAAILAFGTILASGVTFMAEWLTMLMATLSQALTSWLGMFQTGASMIQGGYGVGVNLWNQLGLSSWLTVGLVFYPIFLIILWEEKGTDALMNHLGHIAWVLGIVFKVLSWMLLTFIDILSRTIEAIPIIE